MEELNMYENINEYGGTPGSAAPADVPLDDLPPADNFSEMTTDVPWRDDPPDGGYYSYSEYGESGIDECRQPDSVRAKNQKENSAEKQKNGGHSKKNLAVEYLANGTVSIKSAVRSKKTGEISVDVECARLLLPAETEELEKNILEVYTRLYRKYEEDKKLIPAGNLIEIKFEDFEADALAMTEKIYRTLAIPGFEAAKADIAAYLDKKKGYKKNAYKYETRTVELVEKHWDYALKQWDYKLE